MPLYCPAPTAQPRATSFFGAPPGAVPAISVGRAAEAFWLDAHEPGSNLLIVGDAESPDS